MCVATRAQNPKKPARPYHRFAVEFSFLLRVLSVLCGSYYQKWRLCAASRKSRKPWIQPPTKSCRSLRGRGGKHSVGRSASPRPVSISTGFDRSMGPMEAETMGVSSGDGRCGRMDFDCLLRGTFPAGRAALGALVSMAILAGSVITRDLGGRFAELANRERGTPPHCAPLQ
jgi:hypothetical protein